MRKPKILVIGAGASGIAATTRLLENGFNDITVLEAEDRIGGRIRSVEFAGTTVDLGAQWCHGEVDNVVYDYAKDLNVLSSSYNSYDDFTFYESTGKLLPKEITDRLLQIAFDISYDDEALAHFSGSFGVYFLERFEEVIQQEFKGNAEVLNIAPEFVDWYHKICICLDAAPTWFDVSAKGHLHYEECPGDKYLHWMDGGYKTILDILMKKIPNPKNQLPIDDKIFLRKEVSKIIWDNSNRGVIVECSDDSSYTADHVIVSLPLGVLKQKYASMFSPELPLKKQNAINGLGFGTVNKIILEFNKRWWPEDCKGFSLLWTKEGADDVLSHFPHTSSRNGKSWLEDVFGFYTIDNHPNILLGWVVGSQTTEVESLPDDVVIEGCAYVLRRFLGSQYDVSAPSSMLRSTWSTNPHFYGSYTYRSNETQIMNITAEDLSDPLVANNKQVLLFCGEATHPYYYSTVHGAIESGHREADRLINIYNQYPEHLENKL